MRRDMRHVVRDMARGGSFFQNYGTAMKVDPRGVSEETLEELDEMDFGPKRIPMSMRSPLCGTPYGSKSTGFRSGVLRNFLRSKLGQPWNKVYATFRRQFDHRSPKNLEIIHYFNRSVEKDAFVGQDGKVYVTNFGWTKLVQDFYVHPTTGVLCYAPWRTHKIRDRFNQRHKNRQKMVQVLKSAGISIAYNEVKNFRLVDENTVLEDRDGIWFIYLLTPFTSADKIEKRLRFKVVQDPESEKFHFEYRSVSVPYSPEPNRPSLRVVSVHQMNKKLLRKYAGIIAGNPY